MQVITYPLAVAGQITRVIEAGEGPAILFLHGLGARADRWHGTVARFAALGYRAVAFDLPGHGLATKGAGVPNTVPKIADFVLAVLSELGIETVVLVGTSLGAHIVATVACKKPAMVPGLVLVGALGIAPLAQEVAEAIRTNVKAQDKVRIRAKLSFVIADPALITPALVEEEWRMNGSPGALESFTVIGDYLADGIANDYVAEQLSALYPPEKLLLVWGSEDKAVPVSVGHACQQALGGPDLVLIDGAAHAPYFEQPAAFDAPVVAFIASLL
jgi:2-hydroxy-6-oxonona-2,4-dienedioate hydrolase